MVPHTAEHAKGLAAQIVNENPDMASVLLELLGGLLDPNGEALRYSAGEETMRYLFTLTPQFEDAFVSYIRSPQSELDGLSS